MVHGIKDCWHCHDGFDSRNHHHGWGRYFLCGAQPGWFGGSFSGIAPFQWLDILFVLVTLAFGEMGARGVLRLIRNRPNAYRYALIALVGGSIIGVIHLYVSRALRGSSMPVDMVTYINILTLVIFLI